MPRCRVFVILCCAAWLACAQSTSQSHKPSDDETVYDLGPGITPPRIVKQVNPHYSTDHGVRPVGSVIIALVVTSKGLPKDPRVVKGLDKELDESAVQAVGEWRFTPAQRNGKAIAVRVSVQIQFHEM